MKKSVVIGISAFIVAFILLTVGYVLNAQARPARDTGRIYQIRARNLPRLIHEGRQKEDTTYGMPLTDQEQDEVSRFWSEIASMLAGNATVAYRAGSAPTGATANSLKKCFLTMNSPITTTVDDLGGTRKVILEEDLAKLIRSGSAANQSYLQGLAYCNTIISRFNRLKEIFNRYPGVFNASREDRINNLNEHIDYFIFIRDQNFKYSYDWAVANVNLSDDIRADFNAENVPVIAGNFDESYRMYLEVSAAYKRAVIGGTPTGAGSRKGALRR